MNPDGRHPSLTTTLGLVFVAMLAFMSAYECTKQLISPGITLWESHVVTIILTSTISVVILFFPLRSLYRQERTIREALAHEQDARDKLRQSEAQYRSFVESAGDSIYTVDRDLRYLLINARHLARRGLSPGAYAGKQYGDFHSAAEIECFEAEVRHVVASKRSVNNEYEQDGKFYLRKLNPVTDPVTSEVIAITVISSDITDRKLAEKNLESINKKLNLMNEIVHHDILNRLTVLNSYLSLADEQTQDPAVKKYLFRSEQVSDTIHSMIHFARDYQRIGIESPQWQNIHTSVQHASMSLKIPQIAIDASCSEMEIFADPLLEKVFYNLMDNAMKYAGPSPGVRFRCQSGVDAFVITCEDNGPGISPDEKENLFSRGFGKNTGLGLFLIREILAITGISIRETGEPGRGSRFEIIVPPGAFRASRQKP